MTTFDFIDGVTGNDADDDKLPPPPPTLVVVGCPHVLSGDSADNVDAVDGKCASHGSLSFSLS